MWGNIRSEVTFQPYRSNFFCDGLVEKVDEFVENGTTKAKYRKTGAVMI